MRIISGTKKGLRLNTLEGLDTRPTTDRVKESMFNIIQWDIRNAVVLDLFAGSGGLGLEALSRGAKMAVLVDSSKVAIDTIHNNVKKTGFTDVAEIILGNFEKCLKIPIKYDIIFLDPPYQSDLIAKSIEFIRKTDLLNTNGIIVCETTKDNTITAESFETFKNVTYGSTKLVFLRRLNEHCTLPR